MLQKISKRSTAKDRASREGKTDTPSNSICQSQNKESINGSIDQTKENMRSAVEETRREAPKRTENITNFQNDLASAAMDIVQSFLDSQKEIINSIQSAYTPIAERTEGAKPTSRVVAQIGGGCLR